MTLSEVCEKLEKEVPSARTKNVVDMNQIIVSFINRPDVEIALLTPYYQCKAKKSALDSDDVEELIMSVRRISDGY